MRGGRSGSVYALGLSALCLATGLLRAESVKFRVAKRSEVIATLELSSSGADWSKRGREAALANVTLDGRTTQHIMLFMGERRHPYSAMLGMLEPGEHSLSVERNTQYSAPNTGVTLHNSTFREVAPGDPDFDAISSAPYLYARADSIGQFTDVPLLTYCERTPALQYTIIFSNEDGGTSTRALMARWGRTTDIEYVFREGTIQAAGHKDIPFDGVYEGKHPVLIPSTRNNMVSGQGKSPIRYQIPPQVIDLSQHSREEAMDQQPWSYRVMAQELIREGKLRPHGTVDGEKISDPRNYLYVEVKMDNRDAGLAIVVHLRNGNVWRASHLGRADYAMDRSGWARSTVELPPNTKAADIAEIGFECLVPPAKPTPVAGTCQVQALSKMFFLNSSYLPQPSFFSLREEFTLPTGQARFFAVTPEHVASLH